MITPNIFSESGSFDSVKWSDYNCVLRKYNDIIIFMIIKGKFHHFFQPQQLSVMTALQQVSKFELLKC